MIRPTKTTTGARRVRPSTPAKFASAQPRRVPPPDPPEKRRAEYLNTNAWIKREGEGPK